MVNLIRRWVDRGQPDADARSWRTAHHSTTGAAHLRSGAPCQDAGTAEVLDEGAWAFVVVADGHGSDHCFRSDRGAAFAVAAARQVVASFHRELRQVGGTPTIKTLADLWDTEARRLVPSWRYLVHADLVDNPPRLADLDREPGLRRFLDKVVGEGRHDRNYQTYLQLHWFAEYAGKRRDLAPERLGPLPLPSDPTWDVATLGGWQARAYGTTLLAVLVGPTSVHWLRIGDGAMLRFVDGRAQRLVEPPAEAFANETPSLCDDDADRRLVVDTDPLAESDLPSALLVTTDGLPNSYPSEAEFLHFCDDLVVRARRGDDVAEGLTRWLPELSRRGSGDDMTVALAWVGGGRGDHVAEPVRAAPVRSEAPAVEQPVVEEPPDDRPGGAMHEVVEEERAPGEPDESTPGESAPGESALGEPTSEESSPAESAPESEGNECERDADSGRAAQQ
ncbi:protein phosphatase 2C domain-containing protein [Actinosynnema sp. NPDC020468]|uniref:protein phosphatase 2C domain-containing protein n=1 Tax=Actinosynnema sp. NPDC020468 TaxID=3154488 RepID=UPI0033DAD564